MPVIYRYNKCTCECHSGKNVILIHMEGFCCLSCPYCEEDLIIDLPLHTAECPYKRDSSEE